MFLEDGWKVGLAARREQLLKGLKGDFPDLAKTVQIDITDDNAPQKLLALIGEMGDIDLYFHVSGIGKQNLDLENGIEMNTLNTNALGFTRMIDAVFNYMKEHGGGHIAVISSIAGFKGL